MNLSQASDSEILFKLKEIVLANIENEHFGVDELVEHAGVGKNFLRHRLKILTHKTIHQYIHEIRLNKAAELLHENSMTVSEVAWKTGFGSPEYFIRCYHDYFGHSPGVDKRQESKRLELADNQGNSMRTTETPYMADVKRFKVSKKLLLIVMFLLFCGVGYFILSFLYVPYLPFKPENQKINIAILPFKNFSPDSNNVYFFNRLADMISENLSETGIFVVTPSRSVAVYQDDINKTSRQIARELRVNYLVDGSGQKIGNSVSMTVYLIDTQIDKNAFSLPFEGSGNEEKDLCITLANLIVAQIILTVNSKNRKKVTV